MYSEAEPTLGDLLRDVWAAKVFMVLSCAVFGGGALIFLFLATPEYRAEMIVAPADGYALGDYASSPSLERGVSLPFWRPPEPEGVSTDFYRFVYTARGAAVAEILLKDPGVRSGVEKEPHWKRNAGWNAAALAAYLERRVGIEPLGLTPLRRMAYYHPDPEFAAALLRKIHLVADQMIRRDRRRQSQSRIDYLQAALERTPHPEHKKIITALLMQQEHVQMLANLDEPYAAIVVEPAAVGPEPARPDPVLVVPAALFAGLLAGYGLWAAFGGGRRERR